MPKILCNNCKEIREALTKNDTVCLACKVHEMANKQVNIIKDKLKKLMPSKTEDDELEPELPNLDTEEEVEDEDIV